MYVLKSFEFTDTCFMAQNMIYLCKCSKSNNLIIEECVFSCFINVYSAIL